MVDSNQMVTSVWASMASWFTPIVLFCFLNLMIATIYLASTFKDKNHHHHHHPQENSLGQLARAPSLLNRVKSINFPFYSPDHHNYPFFPQTHHTEEPSISMSSRLEHNSSSQLVRAPSLLERVKSFNFSFYSQEHDHPLVPQPHFEEPTTGISSFSSSREQHNTPSQLVRAPSLLERVRSFNISGLYKPDHPETFEPQTRVPDWGSDHHVTRSKSSEKYGVIPAKVSAKMKKSASEKGVDTKGVEEIERRRPATVRERKGKKETASAGEDGGVDAKADDFISKFKQHLKLQRLDSLLRYKEMLGRGT